MKKILIADDTKNIRNLLKTCLELDGYDVLTACNGKEALDILCNTNLDLAFLDIKMPEISGTEVLRRIRQQNVNIPIIIMTAFATVKNAVECTKLGAVYYLQKPFSADKIRKVLNEMSLENNEDTFFNKKIEMAKELISIGELDRSFDIVKQLLSMDPTSYEVYNLMGKVYEEKKDLINSKKFFSIAKTLQEN